jgi:DNA-binding transcriptional regulator/RsmH inhibitor MraZ
LVIDTYLDAAGTLWVGTQAGLNRAVRDGDGLRFHRYSPTDGVPDQTINAVGGDAKGALWIGTPRGIAMHDAARDLWRIFDSTITAIRNGDGTPCLIRDEHGIPAEYAFMDIRQYGSFSSQNRTMSAETVETFGELIDEYFGERSRNERLHRRAADIFKLLSNAETRITKKIAIQKDELAACEDGEKFRLWGDLITANIYRLKRGLTASAQTIELDSAGRVALGKLGTKILSHLGFGHEVTVIGADDHFEIWDAQKWEAENASFEEDFFGLMFGATA